MANTALYQNIIATNAHNTRKHVTAFNACLCYKEKCYAGVMHKLFYNNVATVNSYYSKLGRHFSFKGRQRL